jgi:GxxExxY protein
VLVGSKFLRRAEARGTETLGNSNGTLRALIGGMDGPDRPAIDDPQTYEIIGAAIAVHNEIGPGFLEPVYKAAFSIVLDERSIPFTSEVSLPIEFHGRLLPVMYRVDFVCHGDIIVEIKAIPRITPQAHAQAINYVKAAKQLRGLLINFGGLSLQYKRCT